MVSVTQVLEYFQEPELVAWKLRTPKWKQIGESAMRVGSAVDWLIQQDLRPSMDTIATLSKEEEAAMTNCLQAWQRFKVEHPLFHQTVSGVQTELTDGELVGHPDLEITEPESETLAPEGAEREAGVYVYHPARWGIIDIKTSKAIQPKHWLQVAAYAWLQASNGQKQLVVPHNLSECFLGILRLDKQTAQYEYKEITEETVIRNEIEVFQAYWKAYQHGEQIREVMRQLAEQEALE